MNDYSDYDYYYYAERENSEEAYLLDCYNRDCNDEVEREISILEYICLDEGCDRGIINQAYDRLINVFV